MASNTVVKAAEVSSAAVTGMLATGLLVVVYGCLILIDVGAAIMGIPNVPFDFGPPLPGNWFPSLLMGLSVSGTGLIVTSSARKHKTWMALLGLLIAVVAVYEIVVLDRMYVRHGRPALGGYSVDRGASFQDRLDRIYRGSLRVVVPRT